MSFRFVLASALLLTPLAPDSAAQTPLTTERIANNLALPVWVGAPAGDTRLFVCEQNTGRIRIVKNGVAGLLPFLDLGPIANQGGERGLLGLAFHPNYAANGFFYVVYSDNAGDTVVARYSRSLTDPDRADATSAFQILKVPQPGQTHNGGGIQFGPDGYLWLAFGDGGAFDPICNGMNPTNLLGKVVRIDVDGGSPYAIPPSNPYAGGGTYLPEVWAVGLRNPWRFHVDTNGELYIGDVGEGDREEINWAPGGAAALNYGWTVMEGDLCIGLLQCPPATTAPCFDPSYTMPVHVYDHGTGCAVTGGVVYRGCAIPDLVGTYFFADYCSGRIWSFRMVGGAVTGFTERTVELAPGGALGIGTVSSFGTDGAGNVLIIDHAGGEVFRVKAAAPGTDCDADGQLDSCEIAGNPNLDLDGDGALDLCEGLGGDVGSISAATGGQQNLLIRAGAARANQLHFVLGSASGTTPPFVLDGVTLPLFIFDFWFNYTVSFANGPLLPGTVALLDGAGNGDAAIVFPPLPPSSVGLNLHHAAIAVDIFGLGNVTWSSHALPLSIGP